MDMRWLGILGLVLCVSLAATRGEAQESAAETPSARAAGSESASDAASDSADASEGATEEVEQSVDKMVEGAQGAVTGIAEEVDRSEKAQEISAGILKPIYVLAEYLSFPAVHWIAFAIMVTGVVSYALQLVLAKLVVLTHFGFSISEILSDALGLVISLVGLVLTTQAAAENSSFTRSPAAVISAALVGILAGIVFYLWGQAREVEAVKGRRAQLEEQAKNQPAKNQPAKGREGKK